MNRFLSLNFFISFFLQGDCIQCDGRNDKAEFSEIRSAMKILTFTDSEIWDIFRLLGSILHFGNIEYRHRVIQTMDGCEFVSHEQTTKVAKLLGVSHNE